MCYFLFLYSVRLAWYMHDVLYKPTIFCCMSVVFVFVKVFHWRILLTYYCSITQRRIKDVDELRDSILQ